MTEIFRCLGSPDPSGGHPGSYQWPERGWSRETEFRHQATSYLRSLGRCLLARGIDSRAARLISRRIQAIDLGVPFRVTVYGPEADMVPLPELPAFPELPSIPRHLSPRSRGLGRMGLAAGDAGDNVPDLLDHLFRLHHGNRKPSTAETALEALPKITVDDAFLVAGRENAHDACAICQDEFQIGDEATRLPCDHVFHMGTDNPNDDSVDADASGKGDPIMACGGVLKWLRDNNECPICRFKLPAASHGTDAHDTDSGDLLQQLQRSLQSMAGAGATAGAGPGSASLSMPFFPNPGIFSEPWVCVGCETENPANVTERQGARCSHCTATRQTVFIATSQRTQPALQHTIRLYKEAEELRDAVVTRGGKSREDLNAEINAFLAGTDVTTLVGSGWEVKATLREILTAPLTGSYALSLAGVDNNSAALLRHFVRVLQRECPTSELAFSAPPARGSPRGSSGGGGGVVAHLGPHDFSTRWSCIACGTDNAGKHLCVGY